MGFHFRKEQEKVEESIARRVEFSKKCLADELQANSAEIDNLKMELVINEPFLKNWWENHYLICSSFQQKFHAFNTPPYHRLSPPKRAAIACYSLFGSPGRPVILAEAEPYINPNFEPKQKIPNGFGPLITKIEVGLLLRTTSHVLNLKYSTLHDFLFGSDAEFSDQQSLMKAFLSELEYSENATWLGDRYNEKVHLKYLKSMARGIPEITTNNNTTLIAYLNIILLLFSYFDAIWCGTTLVPERSVPLSHGENQDNDLYKYQPTGGIEKVLIVDLNKVQKIVSPETLEACVFNP